MLSNLFRLFATKQVRGSHVKLTNFNTQIRGYTDTKNQDIKTKQVVVQGATENEERMRVRRARPADVPRVLRFVREHSMSAWPGLIVPPSVSHIVLCDYVTRALAQGHSMLAEIPEPRRGWTNIRGLALSTSVCPWDATLLEKWARCVRCPRSRRLMHFTAHCLRAPGLHDKYRVHNILQVVLVVPPNTPKSTEIIHVLAKNSIQRASDVGFPVLRFDVTEQTMAKSLEELNLKKEWQLSFDVIPGSLRDTQRRETPPKMDILSKAESIKVEATKTEATKVDAAKVDAKKMDATKVDATKVDATKVDAAKVEATKVDDRKDDETKISKPKLKHPMDTPKTLVEPTFITVYTAFPQAYKNK